MAPGRPAARKPPPPAAHGTQPPLPAVWPLLVAPTLPPAVCALLVPVTALTDADGTKYWPVVSSRVMLYFFVNALYAVGSFLERRSKRSVSC